MSSANDILGAIGLRPQAQLQPSLGTGQQPGAPNAAQSLSARFKTTFNSQMQTVLERGVAGEFDDPTLRLQEQAALDRLRRAQEAAAAPTSTGNIGSTTDGGGATGANAAPDAQGTTGSTGSNGTASAADGASQLQYTPGVATSEMRQLYDVRVKQSEARLVNISRSLRAEYPKAATLASASTGTWDPETFVPRTREEAEAFAQRMVIDATEAAARLEIVQTMRDSARFEAATTGSDAAKALVTKLDEEFGRQKAYVDKLARIVDNSSDGTLTEAGSAAMRGETLRDAGDIPVQELVAAMRASGMDEAAIKRVVGAQELAVEEERAVKAGTPGGSERLQQAATKTAEFTWVNRYNLQRARMQQEMRIQERERQAEERREQKRADQKRMDERAAAKRQERRQLHARALEQRAEQRRFETTNGYQAWAQREQGEQRAEFSAWLNKLAAEANQRAAS